MRFALAFAAACLCACSQEQAPPPAGPSEPPALEAVTLPLADQAGNRMETLTLNGENWCTADGWCVARSALPEGEMWPVAIHGGARAFAGVITVDEQMYSGGGGRAEYLTLYEVREGAASEAMRLPYSGNIDIRACFTEEDTARRADACHDQYMFASRVRLDEANAAPEARIVLETVAATFPGHVSRSADSLERPPLTEAELVWWRDEMCSFRRTYSRGPAGYAPDQELPACADYLEP